MPSLSLPQTFGVQFPFLCCAKSVILVWFPSFKRFWNFLFSVAFFPPAIFVIAGYYLLLFIYCHWVRFWWEKEISICEWPIVIYCHPTHFPRAKESPRKHCIILSFFIERFFVLFLSCSFWGIPTSSEILTDKTEKRNLEYFTTLCLVAQLCLTIAHQVSLPMRILQARILKWVAMPSSRGSSQPRDRIQVSHIAGEFFPIWAAREAQEY